MDPNENPPDFHLPDVESKPGFVRRGFDSIALQYDLLNDVMTMGLHRRWKRETVRRLAIRPGMRILDLCAGTGDLAYRAAIRNGGQGLTAALDFSWKMMSVGKSRNPNADSVVWIGGDAENLPFLDASFDGAASGFGLRNVKSVETALRELHRILKPGALFVSLDTAGTEWPILAPFHQFHMKRIVPFLGEWFAHSRSMYSYLTASAEAFHPPQELQSLLDRCGFRDTGYAYRPRFLGGAALVWGRR
ncbi:MAG: ubiquinone/menaquinone biosynthesis methyltransferase [Candidatus Omnitrophota bacterium]